MSGLYSSVEGVQSQFEGLIMAYFGQAVNELRVPSDRVTFDVVLRQGMKPERGPCVRSP